MEKGRILNGVRRFIEADASRYGQENVMAEVDKVRKKLSILHGKDSSRGLKGINVIAKEEKEGLKTPDKKTSKVVKRRGLKSVAEGNILAVIKVLPVEEVMSRREKSSVQRSGQNLNSQGNVTP